MYILTVLLHKKWDGHKIADRRDEWTPPLPQWALLSKEERLEMHSTHHNQLQVSSYVNVQKNRNERKKNKRVDLQRKKTNKLQRLQKSDLVAAPNIHTHLKLNWPWFHRHTLFFHRFKLYKEFWETSYLKFIPPRQGNNDQPAFSVITQPFLNPTVQLVSQIHWKLPWSQNSTSGIRLYTREEKRRRRGRKHAYSNSVLAFLLFVLRFTLCHFTSSPC